MTKVSIDRLTEGTELCSWFESGSFGRGDDMEIRHGAAGRIVAHTLKMISGLDPHGNVMRTRQVAVTFTLFGLIDVGVSRFTQPGLARGLEIEATEAGITLRFDSVQGVQAWIKAKRIEVSFAPS